MEIFIAAAAVIGASGIIMAMVQGGQKAPSVDKIIGEKIQELMKGGFDGLVPLLGKGYVHETITREGRSYKVGYVVSRPASQDGFYASDSQEPAKPGETIGRLEVLGYVDPVTMIPSFFFKKEISFKTAVTRSRPGTDGIKLPDVGPS